MTENEIKDRAYDLTVEAFDEAITLIMLDDRVSTEKYGEIYSTLWGSYRNELLRVFENILERGVKI